LSKNAHKRLKLNPTTTTRITEMDKPTKTRAEVSAIIVAEVAKRPESGGVADVQLTRQENGRWHYQLRRRSPGVSDEGRLLVDAAVLRVTAMFDIID
jgi:hypothetical protein